MMVKLRGAEHADCRNLWLWRNDEISRRNSLQTDIISWEQHKGWFAATLENSDREILIALDQCAAVGMIRFDHEGSDVFEINFVVAPAARGQGIGGAILRAGCDYMAESNRGASLRGLVRVDNRASQRIFEAIEFRRGVCISDSSLYEYRKTLTPW